MHDNSDFRPGTQASLRTFWNAAGRDGATYFAAEAFAKGGIYVLFVWLATIFTVDGFGILNVFVSLLTLLAAVIGLGLPDGLVRFHFDDSDFRAALGAAIALPAAVAIFLAAVIYPVRLSSADFLNISEGLLWVVLAVAPLLVLRQEWLGVLRARRETGRYVLLRVAEPLLFAAAIMAFVTLRTPTYQEGVASYSIAIGGTCLIGVLVVGLRIGLAWDSQTLKRLVAFSGPLMPHGLAMAGLTAFDQLVLQQVLGAEATGTYAYAYRFAMVMALIVFAVGAAWGPLVLRRLKHDQGTSLPPLASAAFRLLLLSAVILAWTVPIIANAVAGERYAASLRLIPLVVFAYLCLGPYSLAAAYLYSRNRSGALAAASMTAFVINAVLNYMVIPIWGPTGAAVTTIVSYALLSSFLWIALGDDRKALPWRLYALRTIAVAPLILGAGYYFR